MHYQHYFLNASISGTHSMEITANDQPTKRNGGATAAGIFLGVLLCVTILLIIFFKCLTLLQKKFPEQESHDGTFDGDDVVLTENMAHATSRSMKNGNSRNMVHGATRNKIYETSRNIMHETSRDSRGQDSQETKPNKKMEHKIEMARISWEKFTDGYCEEIEANSLSNAFVLPYAESDLQRVEKSDAQ